MSSAKSVKRCEKPRKCKCCNTAISKSFRLIYDEEGRELNIEFLLLDCVGKKVSEKNGLDQAICTKCLLQLQQSYDFKKKCLEAGDDSDDSEGISDSELVLCDVSSLNSINVDSGEHTTEVDDAIIMMDEEFVIDETIEEENAFELIDGSSMTDTGDHREIDDEIQFVEVIDIIEDAGCDNSIKSQLVNDKLSTSITLPTVKKKFAKNAPSHRIKFKPEILADSKTIDVEKIRTSDDLVHILEDDYHSENDSIRKRFTDITDEFKIPKIKVEDFCDNIEYLDESKPIDLDEYIKMVTLISYDEKKCFLTEVKCVVGRVFRLIFIETKCSRNPHALQMCNTKEVKLKSFSAIVQHMYHEHHDSDFEQFTCLINSQCGSFASLDDLKNHYATDHQDIVTLVYLTACPKPHS